MNESLHSAKMKIKLMELKTKWVEAILPTAFTSETIKLL